MLLELPRLRDFDEFVLPNDILLAFQQLEYELLELHSGLLIDGSSDSPDDTEEHEVPCLCIDVFGQLFLLLFFHLNLPLLFLKDLLVSPHHQVP